MKNIFFTSFFVLIFMACSNQNPKHLDKEKCVKLGYKYVTESRLNYRTGKYELKSICLNNVK